MFSWLAHKLLAHNMSRLNAGDIAPTLRLEAADVQLHFPGENSWAPGANGKQEHARWLERFADVGLQIAPDEVVLKGFPWRQTVCVRGRDHLRGPGGELVYENRYVIWARMRWGLIREIEVYEDTEKASALDRWLVSNRPAPVA